MDKEIIRKARQAHIAEYLLSMGIPLIRNGNRYRHKEHDSLIFTENAYYWNSCGEHGNAIDYLVRHMDMGFIEAVSALANIPTAKLRQVGAFEMDKTELSNNQDKVKRYLYKDRSIGYSIINHLIEKKLLFQESQTNNAFFLIRDEHNNCVGAEIQGILKKRFKGMKANSKYGYGFNVGFSNDNTFDYALFFESAIDLMSFMDYKLNHENKSLKRCILISMSGLKLNIVKHSLEVFKGALGKPKVVLCVDNDSAGQSFKKEVERAKITYIDKTPDKNYKDWNEQLANTKLNLKPISRLMKQNQASSQAQNEREHSETKTEVIEQARE